MAQEVLLSPRQVAAALGVSESSVKRWVDDGQLAAQRTAGGHRRIARSEALRFVRATGATPPRPELLTGVAIREASAPQSEAALGAGLHRALLEDDRESAQGLLLSAFAGGSSIASLCDGPIRFALERLGEMWKHDERGILFEHRATDVCMHTLGLLRAALPAPKADAPIALGSAGPEDPYLLPSMMCALVVAELGFRDVNLGPCTPVKTKLAAAEQYQPVLLWHTASVGGDEVAELAAAVTRTRTLAGTRLVAGGRALVSKMISSPIVPLQSMGELQAFARALLPSRH